MRHEATMHIEEADGRSTVSYTIDGRPCTKAEYDKVRTENLLDTWDRIVQELSAQARKEQDEPRSSSRTA